MKLQPLLTEYLIEHGNLPLAGVGRLYVKHANASVKESIITAPAGTIAFSTAKSSESEQQKLIEFISSKLNISSEGANNLIREEGDFENAFTDNDTFELTALGTFQKDDKGTILFKQDETISKYLPPVSLAPLKLPPTAAPAVEEITEQPVQQEIITEPLYQSIETVQNDRWWVWAIIIFAASVILILIKYYVMD